MNFSRPQSGKNLCYQNPSAQQTMPQRHQKLCQTKRGFGCSTPGVSLLSVDGKPTDNLVWKDTVLVPTGSTVDLLVDFSNKGQWMMHCHISEHLEAGMETLFNVV